MRLVAVACLLALGVASVSGIDVGRKLRSRTRTTDIDGSGCVALGGTCELACPVDSGKEFVKGLCPGKPTCCAPKNRPRSTLSSAGPAQQTAAQGPRKICLTFDDGPFPITADLLEMLGKRKVQATFFMK